MTFGNFLNSCVYSFINTGLRDYIPPQCPKIAQLCLVISGYVVRLCKVIDPSDIVFAQRSLAAVSQDCAPICRKRKFWDSSQVFGSDQLSRISKLLKTQNNRYKELLIKLYSRPCSFSTRNILMTLKSPPRTHNRQRQWFLRIA